MKNEKQSTDFVLLEGMTSISALLNTDRSVNDRRIVRVLFDREKSDKKAPELRFLQAKARETGFDVVMTDSDEIEALSSGTTHGGILAQCTDRTIPLLTEESVLPNGFYAYLEGMEDPYNFGNTLRSLYAAGVRGVVLPERNWMTAAGVVARASAGASERLPLYRATPEEAITVFGKVGYQILCAGIRNSVSIFEETFRYPLLLVIGGEKRGISRTFLEKADQIVRIDYASDFRGSLSSAASAAVLAFELYRQNRD